MPSFVTVSLHCSDCVDERTFIQPVCADDHGADCPEWCCTDCGAGLTGLVQPVPAAGLADFGPVLARSA